MSQSTIQNIHQETGPLNTFYKLMKKLQNIKDSSLLGC